MIITNRFGLPKPLVDLVSFERTGHRLGDITVTELIQPPQMLELARRHDHEIEVDASDRLWALWGQAVHQVLRWQRHDNALQEERLAVRVHGWTVTGQVDLYEPTPDGGGVVSDWKTTSAWSFVYKSRDPEWTHQLNLYARLLLEAGFPVSVIQIVGMVRDWSPSKALDAMNNGGGYPPVALGRPYRLPLWTRDDMDRYLFKRVDLHRRAREHHEWPPCSPEEQWRRGDKWAVMKHGAKRAAAVFGPDTNRGGGEEEAWAHCEDMRAKRPKDVYNVVKQEAEPMRCMRYCDVGGLRSFCPQWLAERGPYMSRTIQLNTMAEAA